MICIASVGMATSAFAGNVVIVHPKNNATITEKDLQRLYLAKRKKFSNGEPVIPLNHMDNVDIRVAFDKELIGKSPSQMKSYWAKLVFTGKEVPFKQVESDAEMVELVSKNESAIGYVDESSVTSEVKVVLKF
jgi:ABC-type phosphate transport system substrate-binding protein